MNKIYIAIMLIIVAGCAKTSSVMEKEDGSFSISASASPARGGAAGARDLAYESAQDFCAQKGARAILRNANDRDVYQSSTTASFNESGGVFTSGTSANGQATINFICK